MPYMDPREELCTARHPFIGGPNDQHVSGHMLVAAAALSTKVELSVTQGHVNNHQGALGFPLFPNGECGKKSSVENM